MPKIQTIDFNYSNLDVETSQFIHQQTVEIKALLKKTAQSIVEIGHRLTEVKQKIGHGKFGSWLQSEFNWSVSTANKFMQVSREFKFINFTNLEIAPSALYKLAAPSAPAGARKEALQRASSGEYVTYTTAKKLIEKYKSALTDTQLHSLKANFSEELTTEELSPKNKLETQKTFSQSRSNDEEKNSHSFAFNESLSSSKISTPEILSVIPQEAITATSSLSASVNKGSLWQLGNKHLLFCGTPQSKQFQRLLPTEVSLSIAFPPRRTDWDNSFHSIAKSAFSLFTVYQDQDLDLLKKAVKQLLLLYTSEDDAVVFSYLLDPQLPSISDELNCRCYIAEPNALLCSAAIAVWQTRTGAAIKQLS